jgi:transposase
MLIHLEHISAKVPKDRHALIILDKANWHTSKKLQKFSNMTLMPLPTASPELNPTEQVWKALRDEWLGNRSFDGYEYILQSCCQAWNVFTDMPDRVRQLCSRSWANLRIYFSEMV